MSLIQAGTETAHGTHRMKASHGVTRPVGRLESTLHSEQITAEPMHFCGLKNLVFPTAPAVMGRLPVRSGLNTPYNC